MELRCVTKGRGSGEATAPQPSWGNLIDSLHMGAADSSKPHRDQGQVQRVRGSGFCIFSFFHC